MKILKLVIALAATALIVEGAIVGGLWTTEKVSSYLAQARTARINAREAGYDCDAILDFPRDRAPQEPATAGHPPSAPAQGDPDDAYWGSPAPGRPTYWDAPLGPSPAAYTAYSKCRDAFIASCQKDGARPCARLGFVATQPRGVASGSTLLSTARCS